MWYVAIMNDSDGRKLDHMTLEELRIQAVKRVENGESPETVIRALGFSRARIYGWLASYRELGIDGLRSRPAPGRPPRLNDRQIEHLCHLLLDNNHRQLQLESLLWTRSMVRDLIQKEFDISLSKVSVGRLLARIGLSQKRPVLPKAQHNQTSLMTWMDNNFPAIKKMAKKERATIYFCNEAPMQSDYHSRKSTIPGKELPAATSTDSLSQNTLISAISAKGVLRFMATGARVSSEIFCEFLRRLIDKADHPVYLLIEQHLAHRSKKVQDFAASTEGRLKIFYLPPHPPDLHQDGALSETT